MSLNNIEDMNKFESYIGSNNKLEYLMSKSWRYGFNTLGVDNYAFKSMKLVKDCFDKKVQHRFEYLDVSFDLLDIMPFIKDEEKIEKIFNETECEFTENDLYNYTQTIKDRLEYLMSENKIIFMFIDLPSYFVDEDEEYKYVVHGCCGILMPINKEYKFYYINSHGKDMLSTNYFEKRLSKTRRKKWSFKNGVDIVLMKCFIKFLNKNIENSNIKYEGNRYDTYLGVNLQTGDNHGVCFMIPYTLYYYFGKYYCKSMDSRSELFDSSFKLLRNNRLEDFVHYCFMPFNEHFYNILTTEVNRMDRIKKLEITLTKSSHRFIKNVLDTIVSFMSQSYFRKKMK